MRFKKSKKKTEEKKPYFYLEIKIIECTNMLCTGMRFHHFSWEKLKTTHKKKREDSTEFGSTEFTEMHRS